MSGRWKHGQEQEHESWSERRHIFALGSAVTVSIKHEEILLSGKVHRVLEILLLIAEADLCWRAGMMWHEFIHCTWATRKQRAWLSGLIA